MNSTLGHVALDLLQWQDSGTPFSLVLPTNNFGHLYDFPGLGKFVTLTLARLIFKPQHILEFQSSL